MLIGFGLFRFLSDRAEIEEDLLRERSFLAAWSAGALADELERCRRVLVAPNESARTSGCAGTRAGDSPFHWFIMGDPAGDKGRPPVGAREEDRRQAFRGGCAPGGAGLPECLALADRMVATDSWSDPLLAHHGPPVLWTLERIKPRADATYRLRWRLERILFEDSVRRHFKKLRSLFRPDKTNPGAWTRWLQVGRYRLTGTGDGGRVLGFNSQPRSVDVRDFLVTRNVLKGGSFDFKMRLHQDPPQHDTRIASLAFVDERVGFLVVEDPRFESRLSEARHGTDLLILWFSLAGLVLLASLVLAYRAVRGAMENVQLRENFVASVSHEFRSPLGGLELMIDTLLEGKVNSEPKRLEYLEQMKKETRRLSRLSENLLALGRMQRTDEMRRDAWSPGHAVETAVEQVRGEAIGKNIEIAMAVDAALPEGAGDADLIQMALLNLIDNAIKFSPAGSRVSVAASMDTGAVHFTVRDRGPGISPREQKRIFDWFYRPGDELNRETKGTGLGLAIVREVATRHGGRVEVHSRLGTGTRFDLWIPIEGMETEGWSHGR